MGNFDSKTTKGLTLIELLVAIAVVAIVTAIAVPVVNNVVANVRESADARQAVLVMDFIEEWDSADGVLAQTPARIEAYFQTILTEYIEVPDGYLLTGDGSTADPYLLIVNPPAVVTQSITESSGTLPGDNESTTFTRDATGITINTASANWETMSIQYQSGTGTITDAVFKKMANGQSKGSLTKISNTEVRISTLSLSDFTFGIVYNGGSTGSFTFN